MQSKMVCSLKIVISISVNKTCLTTEISFYNNDGMYEVLLLLLFFFFYNNIIHKNVK